MLQDREALHKRGQHLQVRVAALSLLALHVENVLAWSFSRANCSLKLQFASSKVQSEFAGFAGVVGPCWHFRARTTVQTLWIRGTPGVLLALQFTTRELQCSHCGSEVRYRQTPPDVAHFTTTFIQSSTLPLLLYNPPCACSTRRSKGQKVQILTPDALQRV